MADTSSLESQAEMPTIYEPQQWEEKLYEWWESMGFFRPEQQIESGLADPDAPPFVISMPPPNVTGALHLGHAITSAVEDMLIRHHRMAGRPTLWLPGTDHAGIATQNVVERKLAGKRRHPPRPRPETLPARSLGLEGRISRPDQRPAAPHGNLLRLDSRTFHPRRRPQ